MHWVRSQGPLLLVKEITRSEHRTCFLMQRAATSLDEQQNPEDRKQDNSSIARKRHLPVFIFNKTGTKSPTVILIPCRGVSSFWTTETEYEALMLTHRHFNVISAKECSLRNERFYSEWGWRSFRNASNHVVALSLIVSLVAVVREEELMHRGCRFSPTWRPRESVSGCALDAVSSIAEFLSSQKSEKFRTELKYVRTHALTGFEICGLLKHR